MRERERDLERERERERERAVVQMSIQICVPFTLHAVPEYISVISVDGH